jgi:hypothetical protein
MQSAEATGYALGELCCEYPREASGILAFGAWGATFAYFLRQALGKAKKQAKKRLARVRG